MPTEELLKMIAQYGIGGVVAAIAMWFAFQKDKKLDRVQQQHQKQIAEMSRLKDEQNAETSQLDDGRFEKQATQFADVVMQLIKDNAAELARKDERHAQQLSDVSEMFAELIKSAHAENRALADQLKAVAEVLSRKR